MEKKEFLILIEKYLAGKATYKEEQLLLNFYGSFQDTIEWDERTLGVKAQIEEKILNRIQNHIHGVPVKQPARLWPKIAAAASITIAVSVGIYFYQSNRHRHLDAAQAAIAADIKPGRNKAILTLSNGSKIALTEAKNGVLANQGDLQITKTADGQIIYEVSSSNRSAALTRSGRGVRPGQEKEIFNTIETPRGGQYQVRLPDGSKVWLNAASKLTYSTSFNGREERRVELSGEAYFEIAKIMIQSQTITIATSSGTGPMMIRMPFFVKSRGQEVQVLGTHFNINSYANEPTTKTTLLEGRVAVNLMKDPGVNPGFRLGKSVTLEPNQQSILTGETVQVVKVDPELAVAWKNGQFAYKNTQLQTVMNQIARWYDVEILYENENLKQKLLSGSVSRYANVSGILKAIESTGTAKFKIEGKTIKVLSGG